MSQTTVLGYTVSIDNIRNEKVKRILTRETCQSDICLFSDRHTDHHDRYSKYADHTDKYGDYSDHEQCGAGG